MKLDGYIDHLEKYGPELILDTAARDPDMSRQKLGELAGYLNHKKYTHRWAFRKSRNGLWSVRWEPRRERKSGEVDESRIKKCAGCGLDMPRNLPFHARYHSQACKQRDYRRRRRERLVRERKERIAAKRANRRAARN